MSLDQDIQLRYIDALVGHTIKAVIENPTGKRQVDIVIVTDTGCYLALSAEGGSYSYDEAPTIEVEPSFYGSSDIPLGEYLSAWDSFENGLINKATYELLLTKELEEKEAEKKAKADRLRKQLAELEGDSK
jgi:hypothetical protein